MKVKGYEVFKCDAGWRTFSFLKITTADGIIGWSEYNESFGSPGLSAVIEALMPNVFGMDPMEIELVNAVLATTSHHSPRGLLPHPTPPYDTPLPHLHSKPLSL